jgi:hypothetical protein
MKRRIKIQFNLLLTTLCILLSGCTVSGVDVEQEQAIGLAGELLEGHSFGQTFTLQYNGLYRIDLYTATYARENSQPVIFRILTYPLEGMDLSESYDLVKLEIPADQISNSGPTVITFPPIQNVAGKSLYFFIESPGSVPGDAITVYYHEKDIYIDGQMVVDGKLASGDLAFIAYTQETFRPSDIWKDFYSRASQDKLFFCFYLSLVGVLFMALLITFFWPFRIQKSINTIEKDDFLKPTNNQLSEEEE